MNDDAPGRYDQPRLDELLPLLGGGDLTFFYGVGETGELLRAALPQELPALLLGMPGSGKTCLAAAILRQLYESNGPEQLQVVFLDNDRQIAFLFEGQPQTSAVARELEQVQEALLCPFRAGRTKGAGSPYWLIVVDGWDWLQRDRVESGGGHIWSAFEALPERFAQEEPNGLRGGVLVISSQATAPFPSPFQTTVLFAHDRGQRASRRRRAPRERALLRRMLSSSRPGQFLIERRRPDGSTEVNGLFLAPVNPVTEPMGNRELYWRRPPPLEERETP